MTDQDTLTSKIISALRFPLAVMVVVIHSWSPLRLMPFNPDWDSFTGMDFAIGLQVLLSNVVAKVAVPAFYVISGYLFFLHVKTFNRNTYITKISKRARTILFPYILWNLLALLRSITLDLKDVAINAAPLSEILATIKERISLSTFWNCNTWGLENANWLGQITPGSGPILIPMWFLRDLMVVIVFTPIIFYVLKRFKLTALSILALNYITGIWPIIPGISINATFFFSLGAYFSIHGKDIVIEFQKYRIPAYILYIPLTIAELLFNSTSSWWGNHIYPFYMILSVVVVFNIIAAFITKEKGMWLVEMQKYTFFIYGAHNLFGFTIANFLLQVIPGHSTHWMGISICYLLAPIIAILTCIYTQRLLRKWCPQLLASLIGGRRHIAKRIK